MDVSFPLDKAKRKKYRKKQNANKSRKGINNLPDPILQHTLSYLSTKEAVRTSILMPCLFTCESLEVLILHMFHSLKLPSSISFSCVKRLTLEKVIFLWKNKNILIKNKLNLFKFK